MANVRSPAGTTAENIFLFGGHHIIIWWPPNKKIFSAVVPAGLRTFAMQVSSKACKLPTLHYRQVRGDMIEMYKILIGKYDADECD